MPTNHWMLPTEFPTHCLKRISEIITRGQAKERKSELVKSGLNIVCYADYLWLGDPDQEVKPILTLSAEANAEATEAATQLISLLSDGPQVFGVNPAIEKLLEMLIPILIEKILEWLKNAID